MLMKCSLCPVIGRLYTGMKGKGELYAEYNYSLESLDDFNLKCRKEKKNKKFIYCEN